MSLTPEEIAILQAKAAEADELKQRLAAVDGKKGEILDEKKQLQQQLKELQDKEAGRVKKELEDQGKTAELLEQERKEREALQKQLDEKDQAIAQLAEQRIKDRVRADFLAVFGAGEVFQPDHAWGLLHSLVKDEEGVTTASFKGQKVTVAELAGKLRQDPQYAYLFKPKGASGGMGSKPPAGGQVDMAGNPYLAGGSLTKRIQLELDDPDLAAKLKVEAATAANSKG
jgi:hypothetical protein